MSNQRQDVARFETGGLSWEQRATCGELQAVIDPYGSEWRNRFLHGVELFAAKKARALRRQKGVLLDFGCGTGRFVRFFALNGFTVVGTEITEAMLHEARRFGIPERAQLHLTDGVSIPLADESVDLIWVCGVLKYSLLEPGAPSRGGAVSATNASASPTPFVPVYREIAREMYRVLKPGSFVVNLEMYVNTPFNMFLPEFEAVGFLRPHIRVVHRYGGRIERLFHVSPVPFRWTTAAGQMCASLRYHFDNPRHEGWGFRDYLFIWHKPAVDRTRTA